MRDEGRASGWRAAIALLGMLAAAPPAAAQDLFGNLQIQYQKVDLHQYRYALDGTPYLAHTTSELWLQTYEANHQAYPRRDLLMQSQLRLTSQADARGPNRVTSPLGSLRLYHPYFNLYGSYQPTRQRSEFRLPTGVGDSVLTGRLDTRYSQTQLVGHVAPPRLPQLDLSWIRRYRQDSGGAPAEYGRQQSARLSYAQPWWNAYGGITQLRSESRGALVTVPLDQRVSSAGGAMQFRPRPDASLGLTYDYAGTRSAYPGLPRATTRSHSANLTGDWRFAPRWSADLNWIYRNNRTRQFVGDTREDHEATALVTWVPVARTRVTGGGGLRTVHLLDQRDRLVRYVTTVASADGTARRGWEVGGLASHTTNWDPERGLYSVETLAGHSRMESRRRAHLDLDWQMSSNSDTALASSRVGIVWGARLDLTPLRSLALGGGFRTTRVGPGLVRASGVTRTRSLDATWRPVPMTTLIGSWSSTGVPPNDSPRTVTRQLSAQVAPSPRLQLTGIWSKSSIERASAFAGGLSGREVMSARVQSSLSRRLTVAAGVSQSDPGQPLSSKQYDALVTWSFGR